MLQREAQGVVLVSHPLRIDIHHAISGFASERVADGSRRHHRQVAAHRLDVVRLPVVGARDIEELEDRQPRGNLVTGKVLPVENRHFNHWNTDPWRLDYGGNGGELGAGTVFLLPYYMGLYHGFIE